MINPMFISMLVMKIKNKELNPNTNEIFKLEDIKIEEYRFEVEKELNK